MKGHSGRSHDGPGTAKASRQREEDGHNADASRSVRSTIDRTSTRTTRKLLQSSVAVVGIDPVELISGDLPTRQRRLVEAWAELHQAELAADWALLQAGQPPKAIDPLH